MSQSGTTHTGGGGGAGKANFQDISFTKYVDSSSNALMTALAKGSHIDKCVLMVRKAGEGQQLGGLAGRVSRSVRRRPGLVGERGGQVRWDRRHRHARARDHNRRRRRQRDHQIATHAPRASP